MPQQRVLPRTLLRGLLEALALWTTILRKKSRHVVLSKSAETQQLFVAVGFLVERALCDATSSEFQAVVNDPHALQIEKVSPSHMLIDTPDQAFAEYSVEVLVPSTGRIYRQMYAGRLVAKDGKIQLLRESLDTVAAAKAFAPADPAESSN